MATIYAIFLCYAAHGSCTKFGRDAYPSLGACKAEIARETRLKMIAPGAQPICMRAAVPAWSPAQ